MSAWQNAQREGITHTKLVALLKEQMHKLEDKKSKLFKLSCWHPSSF